MIIDGEADNLTVLRWLCPHASPRGSSLAGLAGASTKLHAFFGSLARVLVQGRLARRRVGPTRRNSLVVECLVWADCAFLVAHRVGIFDVMVGSQYLDVKIL